MKIVRIPIKLINPAPYNPRVDLQPGDPEYEKLKRSIKEFGYVEPLVWNRRTGNLVGGHQRYKILVNEEGLKELEVSEVDLDEVKEKALNIALNKISGDWENNKLAELLQELQASDDIDFELTGFSEEEFDELLEQLDFELEPDVEYEEVEDDEFDVEGELANIEQPVTQSGDIWVLGEHRLLCGDSTNLEQVQRLMNGKQAAMVFTDPPYNVDYTGKTKDALKIQNDHMDDESFYRFLYAAFSVMYDVTEEGGPIYICHADSEGLNFRKAMIDSGWLYKQCIIWVKNSFTLGRNDYHWQHEPILYGWKPGAAHKWAGDRKQSTVWECDKPQRNADHPTMKPIPIPAKAIQNSSYKGDIIFDPFGGSGSTLIAAEKTGRICYTVELDPRYCDVIVKRYEELTGNKATLIRQ
ncbi:DNA methylase family protein (plasmid) [Anoxybacillus sp. B7M1]|uniref:site-specific DNA-methyltransferase n=1 Tax=Anoxybacillus sp. B7M1 TaxID=1490057 RepID=UPI0005CDAE73|nr:site-specific DNA-methyltransferase [Anoxybacillus sp. B7M1]ANB66157.1 DNA methylase family protein [Anoxybacillus sp. B7M1]